MAAALALGLGPVPGCALVTGASNPAPDEPTSPAHCDQLRTSAITDTVLGVLLLAPSLWLFRGPDDDGFAFRAGVVGTGLALTAGASATYGYATLGRCRESARRTLLAPPAPPVNASAAP